MLARALLVAVGGLLISAPALAHPPRGIVVTPGGTVYFSDLVNVRAIDPSGKVRIVRTAQGAHIHALALAADGTLWGEQSAYDADGYYHEAIWRRAPDGRTTYRYGPTKQLARGAGLLRDRAGCTWHHDQAFQNGPPLVHRRCGRQPARLVYGDAADDRRFRPALIGDLAGTALDAEGWFVFRHRGVLRRVAPDGSSEVLARGLAPGNFGLALGANGEVYVAEWENRRVVAVRDRRIRHVARSEAGWGPSGVAWRGGTLFVLEASIHRPGRPDRLRVRRVDGDTQAILATVTAGGG